VSESKQAGLTHPWTDAQPHWLRVWDFLPRLSGLGHSCAPYESSVDVRLCLSIAQCSPVADAVNAPWSRPRGSLLASWPIAARL